ncbi:transglutaminase-like domain-containing protein, partial [Escherichia coli]|uniref:transglutaminase-like domain-containing protein n=1 Tax=Escherichia coli TaxID=562 RepID=UPI003F232BEA
TGNGGDELEEFLTDDEDGRTGYCEQFASAMAVMARSLGIPARVAMGFLEPTEEGRGQWVYSTDDLHAWPELYFAGQGWVRFEPTPGGPG